MSVHVNVCVCVCVRSGRKVMGKRWREFPLSDSADHRNVDGAFQFPRTTCVRKWSNTCAVRASSRATSQVLGIIAVPSALSSRPLSITFISFLLFLIGTHALFWFFNLIRFYATAPIFFWRPSMDYVVPLFDFCLEVWRMVRPYWMNAISSILFNFTFLSSSFPFSVARRRSTAIK